LPALQTGAHHPDRDLSSHDLKATAIYYAERDELAITCEAQQAQVIGRHYAC
jgi:hypothetical protein